LGRPKKPAWQEKRQCVFAFEAAPTSLSMSHNSDSTD
jgi:hypothetical protein